MFLLDTNVLAELRKVAEGKGNSRVRAWAETLSDDNVWISAITLFETEVGIRRMERRDARQGAVLRHWMTSVVQIRFQNRILPVDDRIAVLAASFHVPDPTPFPDSLIAATAIVHGMTIATRNTGDFQGLPVGLINPWDV